MKKNIIIMAAGGTGGHVFPAVSIAKKIVEIRDDIEVIFTTDSRGVRYLGHYKDTAIVQNIKSNTGSLGFYYLICINILKAFGHLARNNNIACVVGFGGYPSVPFTLAASLLGRTTIIHEQNAIMGKANKILSVFRIKKILMAFENGVGTPTRFDDIYNDFQYAPSPKTSTFKILVLGGSQGSKVITDNVSRALISLPLSIRKKLYVYHQLRQEDLTFVKDLYEANSIKAEVQDFFNEDKMMEIYQEVDVVISRSGASTVFELIGFRIPSILIPFARSVNGDQKANAEKISKVGGAIMLEEYDLSPSILAQYIESLFGDRKKLKQMSEAIKKMNSTGNSALNIANEIIKLIK